ncbi:MAG: ribonuclease E activity regulator RraA [Gammaproteobacteria bacterium]|nr:ribonuclease E activity regulator RraA [Gammaproteobacteria bacterium]MDH3535683.1 ribonuclease E activity regulator RraA [Gammaproteobacteria bacterium]
MTFKTADLSDANEGGVQVVQPGLRSFGACKRFHGEILTIRAHGDFSQVREQTHAPGNGRVLVIDNDGRLDCAVLGDLLAAAASDNGWAGIVVNGCIRDSADIDGMDIGVKALATFPRRGSKDGRGDVDVEVEFLGAVFRPGEYLYSDEDGILLSPTTLF